MAYIQIVKEWPCSLLWYLHINWGFHLCLAGSCWPSALRGNWRYHSLQGWGPGGHGARGQISSRPFYEFPSTYWDSWSRQFRFSAHGSECSQRKEWSTSIGSPWGELHNYMCYKIYYKFSQEINIILNCFNIITTHWSSVLSVLYKRQERDEWSQKLFCFGSFLYVLQM